MPTDLVIGCLGTAGSLIVRRLIEETHDRHIRAVDFNDDWARIKKHPEVLDAAIAGRLQFMQGDATDPKSMEAACNGIDGGVVLAFQGGNFGSAGKVDHNGAKTAAEAAAKAGVKRVLLISSLFVTEQHRRSPLRMMLNTVRWRMMDNKLKGEERVRESGAPYTIVRPGRFVSKAEGAPVKLKIGQGDNINGSISPLDVAAICVSALRNPITVGVTFEVVDECSKAAENTSDVKLQQEVDAAEADGAVAYPSIAGSPEGSVPGRGTGNSTAGGTSRSLEEQLRTLFRGLDKDAAVAAAAKVAGLSLAS